MIINEQDYPWLKVPAPASDGEYGNGNDIKTTDNKNTLFSSDDAQKAILQARNRLRREGAVSFPGLVRIDAIEKELVELRRKAEIAFTTDDVHTAYLKDPDLGRFPTNSVYNHEMRTHVASTAYDELSDNSLLRQLYHDPRLLKLVSLVADRTLYLSEDPLGCCSVNVFRPGYHHSFHFDESESKLVKNDRSVISTSVTR
jgi:alkylated DNA repair dioxygenase AlkB